ncbi:MAG TPA: hypothetical protein VFS96_06670, partial [Nitrolancea sp.]|nr:hypothetical protein [Nitrolancea sp.]
SWCARYPTPWLAPISEMRQWVPNGVELAAYGNGDPPTLETGIPERLELAMPAARTIPLVADCHC